MRELNFIVTKQELMKSPKTDFNNIAFGSANYLKCVFKFDFDWNGLTKVANFAKDDKEYAVLIKNSSCLIPEEVTKTEGDFSIQVFGKKGNQKIVTNKIVIEQEGE